MTDVEIKNGNFIFTPINITFVGKRFAECFYPYLFSNGFRDGCFLFQVLRGHWVVILLIQFPFICLYKNLSEIQKFCNKKILDYNKNYRCQIKIITLSGLYIVL